MGRSTPFGAAILGTALVLAMVYACRRGGGSSSEAASTPTEPPTEPPPTRPDAPPADTSVASGTTSTAPAGTPSASPPDGHVYRETTVAGLPLGILRPDRGGNLVGAPLGVNGTAVASLWEPEAADVERFLAALIARFESGTDRRGPRVAARLRAQAAGTPSEDPHERYRGQIDGLLVDGKRVIHGMFFCDGSSVLDQWLDRAVVIDDGGDCYFEGWFDMESGTIPHGFINGEA